MNHKKFLASASAALMILIVVFMLAPGAWAQSKYKTLYKFKGGTDGSEPIAGLIFDPAGNLYGTTQAGGVNDYGTVFKLTPNPDGSWTESVLHAFTLRRESGQPRDSFRRHWYPGNLYGTTSTGGATRTAASPPSRTAPLAD